MRFCPNCGAQLQENARFCGNCGTPVTTAPQPQAAPQAYQQPPVSAQPQPQQQPPQQPAGSVTLCPDGKYHWYYELNMFGSTAIIGTLFKIFGGITLAIWLLANIFNGFEDFLATTKMVLIIFGVIVVLVLIGYAITAAMYGGKYCVLFDMDEKGINHCQLPKQFKKAQAMGFITAIASGNPSLAGAGILAASRNSLYTSFEHVRSIKAFPGQHYIKVNAPLSKNQVYVEDKDFQFVLDYIRSHCPKAR